MSFWVYMLHCRDRTFYVGHTDQLETRFAQHQDGTFGGYTHCKRPVTLVWSEAFATRHEALEVERRIKGWSKAKKLALIRGDWAEISRLAGGGKGRPSTSSGHTGLGDVAERRPISPDQASAKPASVFLHPHPGHLPTEPFSLEVTVRPGEGLLRLRYRLTGPVDLIRLPRTAGPERRDELWRHTCFEAFARAPGSTRYAEFNFSPSTEWAAYQFESHRRGMQLLPTEAPRIRTERDAHALDVKVAVPLPKLEDPLRLNLTAVIEETSGHKSYWALAHPPSGPPDFHHPDCFVLELPPTP